MIDNIQKVRDAYKYYMRHPSIKEDMSARAEYYNQHYEQVEFIIDFFKVRKGIRPRGAQYFANKDENWSRTFMYDNPMTNHYNNEKGYGYPFTDINRENIYELEIFNNFYWFPFIYSEESRNLMKKADAPKHVIGITPVMDIDSLPIDPNDMTKGRHDVLGDCKYCKRSHDMIEKFRVAAMNELEEVGIWKNTRLMHSGNGLYIILPDFYGSIDEVLQYSSIFDGLKAYINSQLGDEIVHETSLYSKQLFKIPFTFHNTFDRVSIPLNKDNEFGYEIDTSGW